MSNFSKKYIISLDQGTTSSRALLIDNEGTVVLSDYTPLESFFPQPGWVEQDANQIISGQRKVLESVLKEATERRGIAPKDISAIGICNQRETLVFWDAETGVPLYHAIVWQCRRSSEICRQLKSQGYETLIKQKTGLLLDPYFSGSKIAWALQNVENIQQKAREHTLRIGTVDSWIIYTFTKGRVHVTDYTNASRTLLFDIHSLEWDDELLTLFGVPRSALPSLCSSSEVVAEYPYRDSLYPIAGIAGDQQAALFGHACFDAGDSKNTYGTGCFFLTNTGNKIRHSSHGLLSTVAATQKGQIQYALEGSVFIAGAIIQWLRDKLAFFEKASEVASLSASVKDTAGVYLVPALVGLGSPYWDADARGIIMGLTRGTERAHIVRAANEAIAYQCYDLVKAIEQDSETPIHILRVDGGAIGDDFLMQFQADVLDAEVVIPRNAEVTALGVAYLAGLAVGVYENLDVIRSIVATKKTYRPNMSSEKRKTLVRGWHDAVSRCRSVQESVV